MTSILFAWRRLARQPGRAVLGVLGVAAIGALLCDMLLLSRGLVVSLADHLDRVGFDVRVTTGDVMPIGDERIPRASAVVDRVLRLPEVAAAAGIRVESGWGRGAGRCVSLTVIGSVGSRHAGWRVVDGNDLDAAAGPVRPVVVSRSVLVGTGLAGDSAAPGSGTILTLQGDCLEVMSAVPPVEFEIVGVAEFPFEGAARRTAAVSSAHLAEICGDADPDEADVLLVASAPGYGTDGTARAVAAALPELHAFSNRELVDAFHEVGFSYFRQISAVLATVTLGFGFLLITTLLTVSVNQRVAEIATLRALGFPRRRIVTDLVCESAMLVGAGGLLALPLGGVLARVLDDILRSMPGLPPELYFFVFEVRAVAAHAGLLTLTAGVAALYPAWLASRLPIAATLRDEVVS